MVAAEEDKRSVVVVLLKHNAVVDLTDAVSTFTLFTKGASVPGLPRFYIINEYGNVRSTLILCEGPQPTLFAQRARTTVHYTCHTNPYLYTPPLPPFFNLWIHPYMYLSTFSPHTEWNETNTEH